MRRGDGKLRTERCGRPFLSLGCTSGWSWWAGGFGLVGARSVQGDAVRLAAVSAVRCMGLNQRCLVVHLNLIICLSFPLREISKCIFSPPLTFPSPFCFVFFFCFFLFAPPPSPSSTLLHPPPLALTLALSSLLISLHNLLGRTPQSIFSSVEDAVFISFMQISRSDTHSIS